MAKAAKPPTRWLGALPPPDDRPVFHRFESYESAAEKVRAEHRAAGYPIDENGIRRQLVTLRALALIWWPPEPASKLMAPNVKT